MEVGYRLIPMVDFQQMVSCWAVYAVFARNLPRRWGSAAGGAHSRQYGSATCPLSLLMKGVEIGSGDAYPGRWLALTLVPLPGRYLVRRPSIRHLPECYLD